MFMSTLENRWLPITYKEDFETGTMAAAAGGVTTIFDMPNNKLFISTVEAFKQKSEMIKKKAYVDWLWISCSHCER